MDMIAAAPARSDAINANLAPLIRTRLVQARSAARDGDLERARKLSAETVLEWLPWICQDADLLQTAIATLFDARGFQLLRRLLAAAQGRRVRFVPISPDVPPPHPEGIAATRQRDGTTVFAFADSLFAQPSRERLVDTWSRQVAAWVPQATDA